MSPVINWRESTSSNPVYPSATYKVKCQGFEQVKASTGTLQLRWKAEIMGPAEHVGRIIVDHTALTDKALWRVANLIAGFGVDTLQLGNMDTGGGAFMAVCRACTGRTAYWRNEQGVTPDGAPKNNIVAYIKDPDQKDIQMTVEGQEEVPDWAK